MSYKYNLLTNKERETILEMYNRDRVNEQKAFTGLKSKVAGAKARIGTGLQGVKSSFSTKNANAYPPSAGLEKDLAIVKTRVNDLLKTIKPAYVELFDNIYKKLKDNTGVYGQGYDSQQKEFFEELNTLMIQMDNIKKSLTKMSAFAVTYGPTTTIASGGETTQTPAQATSGGETTQTPAQATTGGETTQTPAQATTGGETTQTPAAGTTVTTKLKPFMVGGKTY